MGYSKNVKTLEHNISWVLPLVNLTDYEWEISGMDADWFAYKIRECLYIANRYKDQYPQLAAAHGQFMIQVVDKTHVQAKYRPKQLGMTASGRAADTGVVVHGLSGAERAPTDLAGPQTAASVVQAWHNTQPSNTPMRFPQANMDSEELLKLYEWATKRTPPWYMFVALDGALTLQPASRDLEGHQWDPSDLEE